MFWGLYGTLLYVPGFFTSLAFGDQFNLHLLSLQDLGLRHPYPPNPASVTSLYPEISCI